MIAHLKAIQSHLSPLGYLTHLIASPSVTAQYLVLGVPSWAAPSEIAICDTDRALDTDIRVTAAAGTPEGAAIMLTRIRALLSPDLRWARVPMPGRRLELKFSRSEFLAVDRDLTVPGTGLHPAFGVDTYRLVSEPI